MRVETNVKEYTEEGVYRMETPRQGYSSTGNVAEMRLEGRD